MTLLLKQIYAFLQLLHSETGTVELAAGLSFGLIFGFSPILSLQTLIVFIICFFFRIQLGAALLSAFFFKFIAFLFDPVSDAVGRLILESSLFRPIFIQLYNMPIIPFTRFNNSIVMGAGVIGFVLVIPMYFVFKHMIIKYRVEFLERVGRSKFWRGLKATSFYKWYETYSNLYG